MTSKEAAQRVLEEAGEPLHYETITERILEARYWSTNGETPEATVNAQLSVSINRKGDASPFQRVEPGVFALRAWDLSEYEGAASDALDRSDEHVRVPLFPTYDEARHFLRIVQGERFSNYRAMHVAIRDQTGTPQNPVNWKDPDTWIEERLDGILARLARRFWTDSAQTLNPRYTRGAYFLSTSYDLVTKDTDDLFHLTDRGQRFLDGDPDTVQALDETEGIGELLNILAPKTRAMRGDLLPEWEDYLREYSTFGKPSTFKDTIRRRLTNLMDRGFVTRDGHTYVITERGLEYAAAFARDEGGAPKQGVQDALKEYNKAQREELRTRLAKMNPYLFEHLVRDLLEAMGYEDVEVTKQSGDKGVDVVATAQFGITEVKEVVQVKRYTSNIQRSKIDELRGALYHHDAIQGTMLTLSGFSSGAKDAAILKGAPPISLIDGDRLLDLLIEHEIGIQKKPTVLYDVDERYFDDGRE